MTTQGLVRMVALLGLLALLPAGAPGAAGLTVDEAVKTALEKSTQVVNAKAGIRDAKGGIYGAYGALIPTLSLSLARTESRTDNATGSDYIGGVVFPRPEADTRFSSTTPSISTSWGILDLSAWADLSAARSGMKAAQLRSNATRSDVALATRRQFYLVVAAHKLAEVSAGSLRLARDDERRVRAMFEVGSVSKSDLLRAQARTAQAEFDSLSARQAITVQRVALAAQMGVKEAEMADVDTLLTLDPQTYDEAALLAEAVKNRPDLIAAEAEFKSAKASHNAARMARLPYVTAQGQATFSPTSRNTISELGGTRNEFTSQSDQQFSAQVALRWDVFNLSAIDARVSSARASLDRSREAYDALQRNLAAEVNQQLLSYNEAIEQNEVAQRGLESATENLKLTQEKYNVGSATILELIDAQVQLQSAQNNVVRALIAMRVAEAQINRVRGRAE